MNPLRLCVPLLALLGCHGSKTTGDDTAPDTASTGDTADTADTGTEPSPGAAFDRYCGDTDWRDTLSDVTMGQAEHGDVQISYTGLPIGSAEGMEFVPNHPMVVTSVRMYFQAGAGDGRLRIMSDFGRSYADIESDTADLMTPLDFEVTSSDRHEWKELDVSAAGVFLEPTEHYYVVYEHTEDNSAALATEDLAAGDHMRSALWYDESWYGVGDDDGYYNYRIELVGQTFCPRQDTWFHNPEDAPWAEVNSPRVTLADVDGDRDDDVVLNDGSPRLYLNDGDAGFTEQADPWPEVATTTVMVFGDLDNDGDDDAVGLSYEGADQDGDGYSGGVGGDDCCDADAAVNPGATEVDNGYDDDCDGIADDGNDTVDDDADGMSEADGDCDDTREDVYPGAPELDDARDNDCDGVTDEDSVNRVLLNDGTGQFSRVSCPAIERADPTGGGALGDADEDGLLDLYYGNWLLKYPDPDAVPDVFLTGDGEGCFADASPQADIPGTTSGADPCYGVVWVDYNNDGHNDIFVSNYGYGHNRLLQNQGDGSFVDVGEDAGVAFERSSGTDGYGGNTFGADWGDVDNDGDMDLIATNIAHPRYQPWSDITTFMLNGGAPDYTFEDQREAWGVAYDEGDVNATFVDWDNDGDLDMMVTALYEGHYSRIYRNDGGFFTDVTYETGMLIHNSVSNAWADFDADGDMDVIIADRQTAPYVWFFRNDADNANHWVELFLEGTTANRGAVGARVTLTTDGLTQLREVKGGGGHSGNQSTKMVHFGLGDSTSVDSLTVRWPGGDTETFSDVMADERWLLVQGAGVAGAAE